MRRAKSSRPECNLNENPTSRASDRNPPPHGTELTEAMLLSFRNTSRRFDRLQPLQSRGDASVQWLEPGVAYALIRDWRPGADPLQTLLLAQMEVPKTACGWSKSRAATHRHTHALRLHCRIWEPLLGFPSRAAAGGGMGNEYSGVGISIWHGAFVLFNYWAAFSIEDCLSRGCKRGSSIGKTLILVN